MICRCNGLVSVSRSLSCAWTFLLMSKRGMANLSWVFGARRPFGCSEPIFNLPLINACGKTHTFATRNDSGAVALPRDVKIFEVRFSGHFPVVDASPRHICDDS